MSVDTSSYYPEVPSSGNGNDAYSLNRREGGLFGPSSASEKTGEEHNVAPPPPSPSPRDSKDAPEPVGERVISGLSEFLSGVFVPLMMPVYGLILAFNLSILDVAPMGMRVVFTLIVAGIDVLIPILLILLLKKLGVVSDIGLNGRKERLIPYMITTLCFGVTAWFMASKGAPLWLSMFFAGGGLACLVNLIVNFFWKVSAHAAGIAGIVALLIRIQKDGSPEPELLLWLLLAILTAGLLGSARVWLGRHTVWQVLAGYAVGFCCVFFLTMI
ncbi:MAG: hypothetical protein K2M27_10585 [Muribaculaceae bacterium]|nr:hypothetical protein [Muribaculaceae bacterium]